MNEEATHNSADRDWSNDPASADRQPKAPTWDGPPVPSQSGAQTPPWEASPDPQSGPPSPWGTPQPNSGPPSPWGTAQPNSGPPALAWGEPAAPETSWGRPQEAPPAEESTARIVPPPPPAPKPAQQSGRAGWIGGIVAAALVFGIGGYFIGAAGGGEPSDDPTAGPSPSLPLFEATQMSVNREKLNGELEGLAGPWLTSIDNCISNQEQGAPALGGDESRHVTCRYGSAWVHFVVYKGAEQKNAARTYRLQLNLNADEVAPGVQDPARINGGVSGAGGKVIEYAFRQQNGRALCGMSWERDEDPLAASMIEAYCEEDLGGDWAALRDLWQRHS
ncbi:hypothetical protein [Actinoplanes sp. GCM10030250]|uniref:hypothetical protein n=1 Tax=Actinoplanes sp. GCM10030250 TaxID=3273376 RepID=UPI00360601B3